MIRICFTVDSFRHDIPLRSLPDLKISTTSARMSPSNTSRRIHAQIISRRQGGEDSKTEFFISIRDIADRRFEEASSRFLDGSNTEVKAYIVQVLSLVLQ